LGCDIKLNNGKRDYEQGKEGKNKWSFKFFLFFSRRFFSIFAAPIPIGIREIPL